MKGKLHKYGIKIYELCEAKSGYIFNVEVYTGSNPIEEDNSNSTFNTISRICEAVKHKCHTVSCEAVMPNKKGMPKNYSQRN